MVHYGTKRGFYSKKEFMRTSHDTAVYNNHEFVLTPAISLLSRSKIWKCTISGCNSQLYTDSTGSRVTKLYRRHNHGCINDSNSNDEVEAEVPVEPRPTRGRPRNSKRSYNETYENYETLNEMDVTEDMNVEDIIRYHEETRNQAGENSRSQYQEDNSWEIKVTSSQEPAEIVNAQVVSTSNTVSAPSTIVTSTAVSAPCNVVSQSQPSTSSGRNEELHGFFINILPDVNGFNQSERLKFKKRILDVIIQIYDERTPVSTLTQTQNQTLNPIPVQTTDRRPVQAFQTQVPRERQQQVQLSHPTRERPQHQTPQAQSASAQGKEKANSRQPTGKKSASNINVFVTYGNNENEGANHNEDRRGPGITLIHDNTHNTASVCDDSVIDLERVKEER